MTFNQWLLEQLKSKDWTQADLAKKANLSRGTIANLLSKNRKPGPDVCRAIANAFNEPPETVFRIAGLLPVDTKSNPFVKHLMHLASKLPDDEIEDLTYAAEAKLKKIEEKKLLIKQTNPVST